MQVGVASIIVSLEQRPFSIHAIPAVNVAGIFVTETAINNHANLILIAGFNRAQITASLSAPARAARDSYSLMR